MHDLADSKPVKKTKNPFATKNMSVKRKDFITICLLRLCTYFILVCALAIFGRIIYQGAPVVFQAAPPFINVEFFTESPETLMTFETEDGEEYSMSFSDYSQFKRDVEGVAEKKIVEEHSHAYSGGGILGPLVGTALMTAICIIVALFIGLTTAIFLNEYASKGKFMDTVRLAIMNLAGVPSIVFGLFGLGLFCLFIPVICSADELRVDGWRAIQLFGSDHYLAFQGWGVCMLAGGFTLAVMILPVIITACEESLKAIPMGFREAALALGATKWQSIYKAVLPYAFPGMLTASILGITRVAGETAPIMFTAAAAHKDELPWEAASGFLSFFLQSVQAMPYHIYTVAARIPQSEYTEPMQYGSVFVFMILVMIFAALSIFMRIHYRRKVKW